jgi:hypothetical protein
VPGRPRAVVTIYFHLLNTMIRSSPAYSRKKVVVSFVVALAAVQFESRMFSLSLLLKRMK